MCTKVSDIFFIIHVKKKNYQRYVHYPESVLKNFVGVGDADASWVTDINLFSSGSFCLSVWANLSHYLSSHSGMIFLTQGGFDYLSQVSWGLIFASHANKANNFNALWVLKISYSIKDILFNKRSSLHVIKSINQ